MNNADVTLDRIAALELLECLRSHETKLSNDRDRRSALAVETVRVRQELERAIAERK